MSMTPLISFLRRVPLFADLDDAALDFLARVSHAKRVAKDTRVFDQGDPGDAAYIVRAGAIAILLCTADGRELVINEMRAGDCFGELALLTGAPRSASAVASAASDLLVIPRDAFMAELERQPKLMRHLLETIAERLRSSSETERALAFLNAPARLARVLLQLDRASPAGYVTISQEELSQRIGAARQTTARILGQWRRKGWILTGRGRTVVLDRAALRRQAEPISANQE
jgi:CRP-like cAMP-binding protein